MLEVHLLETWQNALLIQNFSSHTLIAYRSAVLQLAAFLQQRGLTWQQCDKRQLTRHIADRLQIANLSVTSVQQELSAIRSFYAWLVEEGHTRINPTTGYQLKTPTRPLPTIADIDVITQLLDQPVPDNPQQAKLWKRDKAMFELLYGSGLRVGELVAIDLHDIDMQQKQVRVLGKGNKTRLVPMTEKSMQAIQQYLAQRNLWLDKTRSVEVEFALFISQQGHRITIRSVQQRLKICAKRSGIAQNLYPHLLRHCFASHLLSESGDLRAVQEMLGHSDISTTQVYTQLDFIKLTQIYDTSHPRAKKVTATSSMN